MPLLNHYAQELIGHQRDVEYRTRLEDAFRAPYEAVKEGITFNPNKLNAHSEEISRLVFERFGVTLLLDLGFNPLIVAYTMPNPIRSEHPFLNRDNQGRKMPSSVRKFVAANKSGIGTYDPTTGRVGGVFSEYRHQLGVCLLTLVRMYSLTLKEICAVFSHEIGHIITWYEYAYKLDRGNQVLLNLFERIEDNGEKREIDYHLRECAKNDILTDKEVDDLANEENRTVLIGRVATLLMKSTVSQSPVGKYDDTSSEQLADAFAARLGYYRELVTGLDKLYVRMGAYQKQRNRLYLYYMWFMEIYSLQGRALFMAWLIRAFFIAVLGVAMAPSLAILIGVVHTIYAVYTTQGDHTKIQTYDELWYRYERIRHQVVDHLKDPAITDASRKHMLGKLDAIVKIQNTTNQWEGILTLLIRKIFSAAHIAKQDTELQQLVELLAHNDLYVESARLKIAKVDIDKEEIEDED